MAKVEWEEKVTYLKVCQEKLKPLITFEHNTTLLNLTQIYAAFGTSIMINIKIS